MASYVNSRVEKFGGVQLLNHGSSYVPLQAGWNLVSLPTVPDNNKIASVLHSISNNVSIVWGYSASTKVWSFYKPGPPASGTLTTMQDGAGYWIYMKVSGLWNITGSVIPAGASAPPAYQLSLGWNLVGFKPQPTIANGTVGAYLSSVSGRYDVNSVWIYDNPTGSWIRAAADGSTVIPVVEAMWVRMLSAATLLP